MSRGYSEEQILAILHEVEAGRKVDEVCRSHGIARSDIDSMFPGYANTGHGVGYFSIDTTKLANGLHTIAWVVHDSQGATQGIGSRFCTVAN